MINRCFKRAAVLNGLDRALLCLSFVLAQLGRWTGEIAGRDFYASGDNHESG